MPHPLNLMPSSFSTKIHVRAGWYRRRHLRSPDTYSTYRLTEDEYEKRDADDLTYEEIANGIHEILKNQISLTRLDLLRESAKLFGYARIGTNVETAMSSGIKLAIERKHAYAENERISLSET